MENFVVVKKGLSMSHTQSALPEGGAYAPARHVCGARSECVVATPG